MLSATLNDKYSRININDSYFEQDNYDYDFDYPEESVRLDKSLKMLVNDLIAYYKKADLIELKRVLYKGKFVSFGLNKAFIADEAFNIFSGSDYLIARVLDNPNKEYDNAGTRYVYLPRNPSSMFSKKEYESLLTRYTINEEVAAERVNRYIAKANIFNKEIDSNPLCRYLFDEEEAVTYIKLDDSKYGFPLASLDLYSELINACKEVGADSIEGLIVSRSVICKGFSANTRVAVQKAEIGRIVVR